MKYLCVIFLALFLSSCGGHRIEKRLYMYEGVDPEEGLALFKEATKSSNWEKIDPPINIVVCNKDNDRGCTGGKVYTILKYLPKKFLGWPCIMFKNDFGEDTQFLVENLPEKSMNVVMERLNKIDP